MRDWRNWQTRKTKDLVTDFRSWKFKSSIPHHSNFIQYKIKNYEKYTKQDNNYPVFLYKKIFLDLKTLECSFFVASKFLKI